MLFAYILHLQLFPLLSIYDISIPNPFLSKRHYRSRPCQAEVHHKQSAFGVVQHNYKAARMLSNIAVCWVLVEIKDSVLRRFLTRIAAQLWSEWELRLMVVVSLFLQLALVHWGKKRQKYLGDNLAWVAIISWTIYLSANSVANLVLSTLLKGSNDTKVENGLIVLWSAFILWHLGSPHNITAYSLEDNDMWLRQFFGLVIQVGEAVYIHYQFRSKNSYSSLHILALPIFIAGVFKAGERIWALRCASEKQLMHSIYPNPEVQFRASQEIGKCRRLTQPGRKGTDEVKSILRQAYLSSIFLKPLFTDLRFKIEKKDYDEVIDLRSESADEEGQCSKKAAEDAFTLVGIELSFVYDLFFTKFPLHFQLGLKVSLFLHGFCFLSAASSLITFSTFDKKPYKRIDVAITYMLLVGAISLDIYLFISHALSKWTIAKLEDEDHTGGRNKLYSMLVGLRLKSMGSESAISKVAQHDLISYFAEAHENKYVGDIRLIDTENLLQKYRYTEWKPVDSILKTFICDHLKVKRDEYRKQLGGGEYGKKQDSDDVQVSILSNLFDKVPYEVLEKNGLHIGDDGDNWELDRTYFAQHVFIWHIATGLVYHDDDFHHRRGMGGSFCKIGKTLSDYMIYLILLRPMMLPKGFNEIINRQTYESASIFLSTVDPASRQHQAKRKFVEGLVHLHDESLIGRISRGESSSGSGTLAESVLEQGRQLAKKLRSLSIDERWDHEKKWEMISEVWMEIMIYAAGRCSWKEHAQQLRHGGELLTHVALLMAHLGLTTKICIFKEEEDHHHPELPNPNLKSP